MAKDKLTEKDLFKQAKSAYIAKLVAKVIIFVVSAAGLCIANIFNIWGMAFTFSVILAITALELLYGK